MSLIDIYQTQISESDFYEDPAQVELVKKLESLSNALEAQNSGWIFSRHESPKGLYIWGGVGRGKSMLMDLFFEQAKLKNKRRVHFHDFMLEIHRFVAHWRSLDTQARRWHPHTVRGAGDDPIAPAAKKIAGEARLLCFDEFHVTDIADAMILGRLFEQLLERDVVIVATSNRHPDTLYENGLNRQLFLPFIDLIKKRFEVFELASARDYRLERLSAAPVYYTPLNNEAKTALQKAFEAVTGGIEPKTEYLEVMGREVEVKKQAAGAAYFHFDELCKAALGAADYLTLARKYHTLFLEGIPALSPENRNEARRFVTLIDALYETRTRLVCSAAAQADDLYPKGDGAFEFERTASRLIEMQSKSYLEGSEAQRGETEGAST